MGLVRWYWGMTKSQRILCWLVSLPCCFLFGIGILMIVLLLYGHMGRDKYIAENVVGAAIVHAALSRDDD